MKFMPLLGLVAPDVQGEHAIGWELSTQVPLEKQLRVPVCVHLKPAANCTIRKSNRHRIGQN